MTLMLKPKIGCIMVLAVLICSLPTSSRAGRIPTVAARPPALCAQRSIPIDGNRIWVDKQGQGPLTVVFDAGFGNDSGVWAKISPKIKAAGVSTLVYDRAGMGRSILATKTPFSIEHDALTLKSLLSTCSVAAPVILVGHSYGGAIALFDATNDSRIVGVVLIDAMVPHAFPRREIDANIAKMRAQYEDILIQAPALARVAIPFAEKFAITNQHIDTLRISNTLPIIDIVAGHGQKDPAAQAIWQDAHAKFVKGNPKREEIVAPDSKHKVMEDDPGLVVKAILKMIAQTRR